MAEAPVFPLWTDAYLADTGHLSTIEHGAYMLLLMTMWRAGGSLPNDDKMLARYARLTPAQWKRIKPTLWPYFQVSSDSITQGRLTDELNAVRRKSKTQSNNARAKYRKNKETGSATGEPNGSQNQPSISISKSISNNTSSLRSDDATGVPDPKKILFDEILPWLAEIENKPPGQLRSLLGKWLKLCGDDAKALLELCERTKAQARASPVEYITAALSRTKLSPTERNLEKLGIIFDA